MPDYPSLSTLGGALRDRWNRIGSFPMTTSTGVTITPEDIQRGMDLGMSFSGGGLGIKAYHGSPHDFSAFDLSKIGTGEGAQAYGHGLYFADNPAVAETYKGTKPTNLSWWNPMNFVTPAEVPTNKGHMYEVDINADPAHFLDWDKPLSEQPHIQDALADKMLGELPNRGIRNLRRVNEEIEEVLGKKSGDTLYRQFSTNPREASQALRDAGVPGIKYLDQGSRSTGEGSRNYVVFNDKLIDIVKKYGLAGLLGGGMLATDNNRQ
jgi:hypothetical protein